MKMTHHAFAAGIIAAALAFRQMLDKEAASAQLRAVAGEPGNGEKDEEDLLEQFEEFVRTGGIPTNYGPDVDCFAGINAGEPSFTLRGQDILASMLTRHWISLYESLAPDADSAKIVQAEGVAEKMEMYDKQKWAD